MAQLVLVVIAGIVGSVGYNEAAKIEKRFRKGPWGIPARAWAVVCFFSGLIGALIASAFVIGALIGFAGYNEAAKYERQHSEGPFGVPPLACGVAFASLGLIGALTASTFAIWALVAFVGYNEAAWYERQYTRGPLGLSASVWGVAVLFFGLIGAFLTSALTWGVVCAFLGLIGALLLLLAERNSLIAEKNALIAERNSRRQAGASTSSGARSEPVTADPRPRQPSAPPAVSRWSGPHTAPPRATAANGGDLLPRR